MLDPPGLDAAVDSLARARHQVARSSTAERVADAVREEVVEGRLRPGSRLTEQRLCAALGVSRNTVRNHVARVYAKIGAHSRSEAVIWARDRGYNSKA